jgi:hypothetical protein
MRQAAQQVRIWRLTTPDGKPIGEIKWKVPPQPKPRIARLNSYRIM